MKAFMDKDFLLDTETARVLYHDYAAEMPIFDYHNHLSPKDIAEHRRFRNMTELWLETDHYKWRALRANGVDERLITGDADDYAKFEAWAAVMPKLIGSPLYHWAHLELQRYFGILEPLCPANAREVWERTEKLLQEDGYDAVALLDRMKVRTLCTTDDPADDLAWHQKIREDASIPFRVLPSFRPDKYLRGDAEADRKLCERYGTDDVLTAFSRALDFFQSLGCKGSDHGFAAFDYGTDEILTQRMDFLGHEYARRGIVMQLHLGPIRNNSPRLWKLIGPDAGADSVGYTTDPAALSSFFGKLEADGALPRTILYNINPADNMLLSTMAGNFAPTMQYGTAWWFNDQLRGMRLQLDELMETNALASSVGMLTDSRSFTSFTRHEYYRRILCAKLGELVESGQYPNDIALLGAMVQDVCYNNAERFFA